MASIPILKCEEPGCEDRAVIKGDRGFFLCSRHAQVEHLLKHSPPRKVLLSSLDGY